MGEYGVRRLEVAERARDRAVINGLALSDMALYETVEAAAARAAAFTARLCAW